MTYDVAIVGGGPGGSTTGTLLRKYAPELRVVILEREHFPREHVGESQLPPVGPVLEEMGCWDKVEAANFPLKIGGAFRWGKSQHQWAIQFVPRATFEPGPRPGPYEGQRRLIGFQVDRAIYDDILLRHATEMGCEVRQGTRVAAALCEGDRITGLRLDDGETITARYYVDASGHAGLLRRALGVTIDCPTRLRNVAFWDYWENPAWAAEIGSGGTLVHITSVSAGWIWLIPLGPTRASIGLVCPAHYYRAAGRSPEALYHEALRGEPTMARLMEGATCRQRLASTTDWSFLSDRMAGENWLLVGEAAGFADPILSAGLTLTHVGAREAAYTLMALLRGEHEPSWLKAQYEVTQQRRIGQHIRFADFFYAANGQFTHLKEHCQEIARAAGLELTPEGAWRWLSNGGFTHDALDRPAIAGFDLDSARQLTELLTGSAAPWKASDANVFELDLEGAQTTTIPVYEHGRIRPAVCYVRGERRLPLVGFYGLMVGILGGATEATEILRELARLIAARFAAGDARTAFRQAIQILEILVSDGWVRTRLDPDRPRLALANLQDGTVVHALDERGSPA